jgi:hypothetical protein
MACCACGERWYACIQNHDGRPANKNSIYAITAGDVEPLVTGNARVKNPGMSKGSIFLI